MSEEIEEEGGIFDIPNGFMSIERVDDELEVTYKDIGHDETMHLKKKEAQWLLDRLSTLVPQMGGQLDE